MLSPAHSTAQLRVPQGGDKHQGTQVLTLLIAHLTAPANTKSKIKTNTKSTVTICFEPDIGMVADHAGCRDQHHQHGDQPHLGAEGDQLNHCNKRFCRSVHS